MGRIKDEDAFREDRIGTTIPFSLLELIMTERKLYYGAWRRSNECNGGSVVAMYKWMHERSLKSPKAANLFRLVHDWELTEMHCYSERNSDFRHGFAKILTLPLLVTTHSTDYARSSFGFLRDWAVCWPEHTKQLVASPGCQGLCLREIGSFASMKNR